MKKTSNKNEVFKALSLITQIGINIVACIIISFFIGKFIDNWLSTSPIFLLIFILLGIIASFRNMYYLVKGVYKGKGD